MATIIKKLDITGIGEGLKGCREAYRRGSNFDVAQSVFETYGAVTDFLSHLGTASEYLGYIGIQVTSKVSQIMKHISPLLAHISLTFYMGGLSLAGSTISLVKESLCLSRQIYFLSNFEEAVSERNLTLKRSLPKWLAEKVFPKMSKAEKNVRKMFKEMDISPEEYQKLAPHQEPQMTPELMQTIRDSAMKKTIQHILGVVGAVLGIIGSIGVFVTFPPLAVTLLLVAAVVVTIVAYVYEKGVVENPEGGFAFKKCLPEFIVNLPKNLSQAVQSLADRIEKDRKKRGEIALWRKRPVVYRLRLSPEVKFFRSNAQTC